MNVKLGEMTGDGPVRWGYWVVADKGQATHVMRNVENFDFTPDPEEGEIRVRTTFQPYFQDPAGRTTLSNVPRGYWYEDFHGDTMFTRIPRGDDE